MENPAVQLYRELERRHGSPAGQWALWCKRPKTAAEREQVVVESILTQRTNWRNVETAFAHLAAAGFGRLGDIRTAEPGRLAELIRATGFYRQKSARLQGLAEYFHRLGGLEKTAGLETGRLREQLLALAGVGPETADSILLYALERPVFVIDEYTRRLASRLGLAPAAPYRCLQAAITARLAGDFRLYQDFHALIVIAGKAAGKTGRPVRPG